MKAGTVKLLIVGIILGSLALYRISGREFGEESRKSANVPPDTTTSSSLFHQKSSQSLKTDPDKAPASALSLSRKQHQNIDSLQENIKQRILLAREQGLSEELKKLASYSKKHKEADKQISPVSRKIHPALLRNGQDGTQRAPYLRFDQKDRILVRITYLPGETREESVRQLLEEQGASVYAQLPEDGILEAYIDEKDMESWALQTWVRKVAPVSPVLSRVGAVTTEADQILGIERLRGQFQISGQGVRVGVISSGVAHIQEAQTTGDLPDDVVVLSAGDNDDEGTAILEIIHDLAPGAKLYFHDGNSETRFIQAVRQLTEEGCRIIMDDLGYPFQPYFEDGTIAREVRNAVDSGIVFVSSAGNDAERHAQLSWSGSHANPEDINVNESLFGVPALVFPDDREMMPIEIGPRHNLTIVLQWTEAFGSASHDYDVYIYDSSTYQAYQEETVVYLDWMVQGRQQFAESGSWVDSRGVSRQFAPSIPVLPIPIAKSTSPQMGKEDPFEVVGVSNFSPDWESVVLVVEGYANAQESDSLKMFFWDSGASGVMGIPGSAGTSKGSIYGHPAVPGCLAVGAVDVHDPGLDDLESFSSQGPSFIPFSDQTLRNKPDLVSVDGITVTGAGDLPQIFYGTSAASPHVAAFAALLKEANPDMTSNTIWQVLTGSALDRGETGRDDLFGYGLADLESALNYSDSGLITVDSDQPLVEVSFKTGQKIDLKCKAAADQKVWVFLEASQIHPGLLFARPSDALVTEEGRYLFVFQDNGVLNSRASDFYFSDAFPAEKIDFGVNDFSGAGTITITTKKGTDVANLETIQEIRLIPDDISEK